MEARNERWGVTPCYGGAMINSKSRRVALIHHDGLSLEETMQLANHIADLHNVDLCGRTWANEAATRSREARKQKQKEAA